MRGSTISIPIRDGSGMPCEYFAVPNTKNVAIVMIPPIFGIHDDIREIAWEYAINGFPVLAIDSFFRSIPGPLKREGGEREKALERYENFDVEQGMADLDDAVAALRNFLECNGKVAVLGYCFGGRYTFLAATRLGVDGAVSFHGTKIGLHLDEATRISCPIQIHVGDSDPSVPIEEVERTQKMLESNKLAQVFVYSGAVHGFTSKGRPSYHEVAHRTSRDRALALLRMLR